MQLNQLIMKVEQIKKLLKILIFFCDDLFFEKVKQYVKATNIKPEKILYIDNKTTKILLLNLIGIKQPFTIETGTLR